MQRRAGNETGQAFRGESRRFVVYGLVDLRDGSIRYIGRTQDLKARLSQHRTQASRWWVPEVNQRKHAWFRELHDAGLTFGACVLEAAASFGALCDAEEEWIARALALGWPLTNGHGKSSGRGPGGIANRFAIAERLSSSSTSPAQNEASR